MSETEFLNKRVDKIDGFLEKLTEVSVELKSMLAVHEQRLGQHDKHHDYIEDMVEQRRVQTDKQIDEIYNTMRNQDDKILLELQKMREDTSEQHKEMSAKISKMEKFVWLAIGGGMTFVWLISYVANYYKILGH
jgi:uncharacterized protein YPO0396